MEIGVIVVALVLIVIAWKVLSGLIKFGLIIALIAGAVWVLTQGGM